MENAGKRTITRIVNSSVPLTKQQIMTMLRRDGIDIPPNAHLSLRTLAGIGWPIDSFLVVSDDKPVFVEWSTTEKTEEA